MTLRTLAVSAALLVSSCFAQDYRATILGQVTDPSGSAIPGAVVKATRVDTNQSTEVKANAEGIYSIPFLNPGVYDIEVSAPGFASLKRENIVLATADKLNLPLKLAVGQMTQEVTVIGQQEALDTANASRGLNFDPIKTQEYPLNGRQTYMLLALTPGVIFAQEAFGATGFSGTRGWDVNNEYMINGGRNGTSQFLLNGAPISDKDGTWQLAPNVEAVQEFKVMTNTYDAQYGRFTGGVVNTTLKSGTNNWHGDVFEYFRNRVFDANLTQNNSIGAPRGAHNQHQFGGIVGGPIRKDKDFIFYSQESWREITPFGKVSNVPVLDLRDGQHFSEFGITIFDPYSTHICDPKAETCGGSIQPGGTSTYIRNPFPQNVIPKSMISPVALKILSFYPAPNIANQLQQNFVAPANTGHYHYNQPMGRWDHIFGPNDRLYALSTYQHGYEFRNSTGFPPPIEEGEIFSQRTDQNDIAAWTHVISANKVLDVRASFGRFTSVFPRISDYTATPQKTLGMTNMIHAPSVSFNVLPTFTFDNTEYARFANNTIDWTTYNQYNLAPSLAVTKSKHSLHFGIEINYTAKGTASTGNANGIFNFNRNETRQLTSRGQGSKDGDPIASLLLGLPDSGHIDYQDTYYRTRPYYGFYVQDDWKVSPHVTLNLGVRYDINVPWLERFNRLNAGFASSTINPDSDAIIANWVKLKAQYDAANPNAKFPYPDPPKAIYGGLLFAGKNGQPRRTYDTDYTDIAPRIGVAWQFAPKTVLRAGAGIFYRAQTQENTTTGFNQATAYKTSLDGITPAAKTPTGAYSLVDPFPDGLLPVAGSSLGLLTNVGNGISYDSRSVPMPRSYQYSFGIQRELPAGIVADVSYSGNYSVHDTYGLAIDDAGALTPLALTDRAQAIADTSFYDRQLPNPMFGILPANVSFGNPTISAQNLLRPYPEFNGITANTIPKVHYRYDALQVGIQKRAFSSKGAGVLTFVLSYTFSKGYEQNHRLNTWNYVEPLIYEVDNQDKPQNIAFSGTWDLPIGTGRRFASVDNKVAKTLVNDWRFTWIYTYYSGYPVGWPDLVNSCSSWHYTGTGNPFSHWFNNDKTCYKTRPANTPRVVPDRFPDIRNPAEPQLNIALEKNIHLTERYSMLIRGEAFNLTNTPIYGGPSTSFNDPRFGMIPTGQENFPRFIQLAAKFIF
jgi:carboxypeptidase family protein/TonB-dependent receptor-like protein